MMNNKSFWIAQMAALGLVYALGLFFGLSGQHTHPTVLISVLLLAAHALEIPLALYMLKGRSASLPRLLVLTLLFGLIWWIPARRGIFQVN
ncbi:MAG: hypothetical protein V4607_07640 [Pseudomonadota bacterium]